MSHDLEEFHRYRQKMNEKILQSGHLGLKRFFALDHQAYQDGALPARTKEMLGLVASLVLRCDDCITYHIVRSAEEGVSREEFLEVFNIGMIVGGSITIPHVRRAFERMEQALETRESRTARRRRKPPESVRGKKR